MPLDDIDRKLAQAAAKAGAVPAARLGELSQRAEAEQKPLARVLLEDPAVNRDAVLALLRSLHAGFPAHEEDALDRHEDRLIARLALRINALDEATARAVVAEQDARRASGQSLRLGELLVAQGKLDPSTAERLYRQFENAAVVCLACFAPNARNRAPEGTSLACPRCGASAPVPPPAAKPGWTTIARPQDAPSDVVFEAADEIVQQAAKAPTGDASEPDLVPKTPSGRTKPLASQKRRRPNLAPPKKGSKLVAGLAIGGLVLVFVGIVVAWKVLSPSEGQIRFAKFADVVKVAREKKTGGAIEEAAQAYASALDLFKDVKPPRDGEAAVEQAHKECALCADFAKRTAKMSADGDATPLCELAKTCDDKEVLNALVDRLARSKDPEAAGGLVTLSASGDEEIRRVATKAALLKGGVPALPLIEKMIAKENADERLQKDAVFALLKVQDKAAVPVLEKALARFPKIDGLWLQAAQLLATIQDEAAVPLLKKLAKDPRSQISEAAIAGLAKIAPQEATAELVAGLDAGETVAASCLEQLRKMGDKAIAPLAAALGNGQATAAVPLIAIASPRAISAIRDTLPKLSWDKRGSVLELLCNGSAPAGWLASTVGKIVQEARDGLAKKDERLTRTVLQQVVLAAKTFGFPDAAQEIKFELRFIELADRSPQPIGEQNLETTDEDDPSGSPRLELHNYTEVRLVLYARGPESVELHAVSNTESGRELAAGEYEVWVARVAEDGREVDPAHAKLKLETGKVTSIVYGVKPDDPQVEASRAAARKQTADTPAPPDESESDKLKRIFDRGFRAEQIVEDAKKELARRLKEEAPWPAASESTEKTPHYKVSTDDGATMARKVAAELERAYAAYANILSAPSDVSSGGFVVRFFKNKSDYDAWRSKTSLSSIYTDALSKDKKLPARTRALAEKGKKVDPEAAAGLLAVADALETARGVDELEVENLEELDDELARAEKATDPRLLARSMQRALVVVRAASLVAAASGHSPHGTILGHYNPASRELCLFDVEGWERTLRHEAFHQFLFAHAAKAPSWLHEGLATYFEALDKQGKNAERIEELRRAHESQSVLETLKLSSLLQTERLSSLDYAIAWSFIYYLVEKEPQALGKILARAREGKASTFGIVSAFDDMLKTEEGWQKMTRKLVLGP